MIVLDLDTVPTRLVGSIPCAVVNFASATNVDTVFVDGVFRKQQGELVGADYCALAQQAETIRDDVAPKLAVATPQPERWPGARVPGRRPLFHH